MERSEGPGLWVGKGWSKRRRGALRDELTQGPEYYYLDGLGNAASSYAPTLENVAVGERGGGAQTVDKCGGKAQGMTI